ncbi:MAG: 6-hydroxymethylpterin diphosphokinase MptE-like protein, partial [Lysinibacillus sp.]
MNWQLSTAKNGEQTLSLNGVQIYSSYRPREDARRWVEAEFDASKSSYLLIGLGLGYHAERLIELAGDKTVYVYYFDQFERTQTPLKQAIETINHIDFSDCQVLIPNVWVKAIGQHPLLPFLEDIKINQQSFKRFSQMMANNFEKNKRYIHDLVTYPTYEHSVVCIVASGPSLNETIEWLKSCSQKVTIFVVGSALKILLQSNIEPHAVFMADAQDNIIHQIKD